MGFPQSQSEAAIQAFGTVQAALEALLAGKGEGMNESRKIRTKWQAASRFVHLEKGH